MSAITDQSLKQGQCAWTQGPRFLKSRQICTEVMESVPQNSGLTIKVSMFIIWVNMPEIQTNLPRHVSVVTDRCQKQRQCAWTQGQDA